MTTRALGKLQPPYPVECCANNDCQRDLDSVDGAFLYTDLTTDKLVVLCDDCARFVELSHADRFKLVAL